MPYSEHNKAYHQGIRHPCPRDGCSAIFNYPRDLSKHIRVLHGEPREGARKRRARSAQPAKSRTRSVTSGQPLESVPQRDLPEPVARGGVADQAQFDNRTNSCQALVQDGNQSRGGFTVTDQPQFHHQTNSYQALVPGGSLTQLGGGVADLSLLDHRASTPHALNQGGGLVSANLNYFSAAPSVRGWTQDGFWLQQA